MFTTLEQALTMGVGSEMAKSMGINNIPDKDKEFKIIDL